MLQKVAILVGSISVLTIVFMPEAEELKPVPAEPVAAVPTKAVAPVEEEDDYWDEEEDDDDFVFGEPSVNLDGDADEEEDDGSEIVGSEANKPAPANTKSSAKSVRPKSNRPRVVRRPKPLV